MAVARIVNHFKLFAANCPSIGSTSPADLTKPNEASLEVLDYFDTFDEAPLRNHEIRRAFVARKVFLCRTKRWKVAAALADSDPNFRSIEDDRVLFSADKVLLIPPGTLFYEGKVDQHRLICFPTDILKLLQTFSQLTAKILPGESYSSEIGLLSKLDHALRTNGQLKETFSTLKRQIKRQTTSWNSEIMSFYAKRAERFVEVQTGSQLKMFHLNKTGVKFQSFEYRTSVPQCVQELVGKGQKVVNLEIEYQYRIDTPLGQFHTRRLIVLCYQCLKSLQGTRLVFMAPRSSQNDTLKIQE